MWLRAFWADIISAVRCERSLSVEFRLTGARPLMERTKLIARSVATRDEAEVLPTTQRLSLPVKPVPRFNPAA